MTEPTPQPPEVTRLGRLQLVTLLVVLATAGLVGYSTWGRVAAPPPGGDQSGLQELRERIELLESDLADIRTGDPALGTRLEALESAVSSLEPGSLTRIRPGRRWVLFRFRKRNRRPLEVAESEQPGFPEDGAELEFVPVSPSPESAWRLDAGLSDLEFTRGVLLVSVAVRTDNNLTFAKPLLLRCTEDGQEPDDHPLFPHLFHVDDSVRAFTAHKVASDLVTLSVTPRSVPALVVDTTVLAKFLKTRGVDGGSVTGHLDVLIGIGPLITSTAED